MNLNTAHGIIAILRNLKITILTIAQHKFIWGLSFGFFLSSVIHLILITETPQHIPHLISNPTGNSFKKIHQQNTNDDGSYHISFYNFATLVETFKVLLFLGVVLFLLIILITLIKF